MKTACFAVVLAAACMVGTGSAFAPMATRAVGKKAAPAKKAKKAPAKKAPVKKAKAAPSGAAYTPGAALPTVNGYPSLSEAAESWKPFARVSGGGNKAPPATFAVPDFSDPKLQIERDPAFYKEAAKTRLSKGKETFAYDDGLTILERQQRKVAPGFLTGSARSQIDPSAIDTSVGGEDFAFGLDADRFQLLFISVFGFLTLVGCLSGTIQL